MIISVIDMTDKGREEETEIEREREIVRREKRERWVERERVRKE